MRTLISQGPRTLFRRALFAALLPAGVAWAAQPAAATALTLAEAERLALADEPGRQALLEEARALSESAVAAGQLPDPQLQFGAANLPLETGDFRTEAMTHMRLGVRQAFPPAATRRAASEQALAGSRARQAAAAARERMALKAVRNAWLDVYVEERSLALVAESHAFFADLVAVARSQYAVGRRNQQDVLRAELEDSGLDARHIAIEQRQAVAHSRLQRWLGGPARALRLAELPRWTPPPALPSLREGLPAHPAIAQAQARLEAADAALAKAQAGYAPQWAVDVSYAYRDGGLPDGNPRSDLFSVTATVGLPWFTANRQDRRVAAALADRRGAQASLDDLTRQFIGDLNAEHARWRALTRRVALHEEVILPQADASAAAALDSYRSEAGDFADMMRAYIDDLEVRLDLVALRVALRRSHAELAYLGGFPL